MENKMNKELITIQFLGFNPSLGCFSCTVFKGDLNDGNGVLLDETNKTRLMVKALKKAEKMAGGELNLVSCKKWISTFTAKKTS
jgi:hypothetical protein